MGRGRVQLRRIENKVSRQVTFSKRRTGLLKKAHEISVLCDADVALIVFSTKGKLFEFSSDSSMDKILEKYEQYSKQHFMTGASETQDIWPAECPKLMSRLEVLQRNIRQYTGQELDPLSLRELQHLEQQIDTALKRVRVRKNQLMHDSVSGLQKKEKALQEQNNLLAKQLQEKEKTLSDQHAQWEQPNLAQNSSAFILPSSPPLPFPALTIGGTFQVGGVNGDTRAHKTQPSSSSLLMPPWMIRYVNGLED